MHRSTVSSGTFLSSKSKAMLLFLMLSLFMGKQGVNCGRQLRSDDDETKKILFNSETKSIQTSQDENSGDTRKEYDTEKDTIIDVVKNIPLDFSKKSSFVVKTNPSSEEVSGKSIGNGINNDRDLEIKVSLLKSPAKNAMNNLAYKPPPPVSPPLNKIDSPTSSKLSSDSQAFDSKSIKWMADDIAEAILLDADELYASMNHENTNSGASNRNRVVRSVDSRYPPARNTRDYSVCK